MAAIYWNSFCGNATRYDPFWSDSLTINTYYPDLTLCLQRTALTWPALLFLFLGALIKILLQVSLPRINGWFSFSRLNLMKTLAAVIQVVTSFCMIFWMSRDHEDLLISPYTTPADYVAAILRFLSMILALVLIRLDYLQGVITSALMSFYWLLLLICDIFIIRSNSVRQGTMDASRPDFFVCFILYFICVVLQFFLVLLPDRSAMVKVASPEKQILVQHDMLSKKMEKKDEQDSALNAPRNPFDYASFYCKLTFTWILPDVFKMYRHKAVFSDLYRLRVEDKVKTLLRNFYRRYFLPDKGGDLSKGGNRQHRSLLWTLFVVIKYDYAMGVLIRLISIPVVFINPQLLRVLINFVTVQDPQSWKGIMISLAMFCCTVSFSVCFNNFLYHGYASGMKARSVVNGIVYRKALKLSSTAKKQTTTGQIVNLMSVDAQKVQDMFLFSTLLWSTPIFICLCMVFLWQVVGAASLAGLAVLAIIVPLNAGYFAKKSYNYQGSQMVHKDARFRIVNEILTGMKVLKLYAWERSFEKKISLSRAAELRTILKMNLINAFGALCSLIAPYLVSLAVFTAYILYNPANVLTPDIAFVSLSLINILNNDLNILPLGISNTSQGLVSVKRIAKFLELDELEDDGPNIDTTLQDRRITMENSTYAWERTGHNVLHENIMWQFPWLAPRLKDCLKYASPISSAPPPAAVSSNNHKSTSPNRVSISMSVPTGSLVAVVGPVGSGKSSLIASLLGDMFQRQGSTRINGSIAYVPQQAWILHNTLRDNITFGKDFIDRKYKKVIQACALEQDLAMLPGGDDTEIGEKGINLSGGQKQRVSLARAVYQDMDLYLLDDPLSAVDAHVGKHIFDHVVGPKGVLKDKTRVFVTHGIPYLPHCDLVYVLKDGHINDVGRYEELLKRGGAFAEIVRNYLENEVSDDSDPETEEIKEQLSTYLSTTEASDTSSMYSSTNVEEGRQLRKVRRRKKKKIMKSLSRQQSSKLDDEEAIAKGVKLVKEEMEGEGSISFSVIKAYVKAGGMLMFNLVIWSHLLYMIAQILTNLWLSDWTSDSNMVATNTTTADRGRVMFRLTIYGVLGIVQTIAAAVEAFAIAWGCYLASESLHFSLLDNIIKAPMAFFDTTPLGRVMNRFSKDVDVVDANLPIFIRFFLFTMAPVIITIFIIVYSTPVFAIALVPLAIFYVLAQRLYVTSIRQWKRIDSVRRSPIYTHIDESVVGTASIRAYCKEKEFVNTCDTLIDESQRAWFLIITAYRWCGLTMDTLGGIITFLASLFAVLQRGTLSPGAAGLSVSYALQMTGFLNGVVRTGSELETYIVSVERIDEYLHIESEAAWEIEEKKPATDWPEKGAIDFSSYSTRYRSGLDLVLKDISCNINPGEKIGIVGRTGAGKSSLSLALFRIIESAGGTICIDGKPIHEMGLHHVRSRIGIIPQDPVVFSGSLRSNLDPFDQYNDLEIWQALDHAHLKEFVEETDEKLDYECGDAGEALSIGQRQLLCLARALLKKCRILVLDEATAAVDFETDSLIQNTIKTKFTDCTILTVAHRLHTVMNYDRIMVLDKGRIIELDTPEQLLADKSGTFYSMAKDAGLVL